jgi:hypothetical protein
VIEMNSARAFENYTTRGAPRDPKALLEDARTASVDPIVLRPRRQPGRKQWLFLALATGLTLVVVSVVARPDGARFDTGGSTAQVTAPTVQSVPNPTISPPGPADLGLPEHAPMPSLTNRADTPKTRALAQQAATLLPGYKLASLVERDGSNDWYVEAKLTDASGIAATLSVGSFFPKQMNDGAPGEAVVTDNFVRTYARTAKDYQVTLVLAGPLRKAAPSLTAALAAARPTDAKWAADGSAVASALASLGDDIGEQSS